MDMLTDEITKKRCAAGQQKLMETRVKSVSDPMRHVAERLIAYRKAVLHTGACLARIKNEKDGPTCVDILTAVCDAEAREAEAQHALWMACERFASGA